MSQNKGNGRPPIAFIRSFGQSAGFAVNIPLLHRPNHTKMHLKTAGNFCPEVETWDYRTCLPNSYDTLFFYFSRFEPVFLAV